MRRSGRFLGSFLLFLLAAGCDGATPLDPSVAPSFRRTDAPSGLNLIVVAHNRIDAFWQDNSPNETGFEVHRAPAAVGAFALLGSTSAGATGFTDGSVSALTQYCYRVRALRTTGRNTTFSEFSNVACATTLALPVPAAPSGTNVVPSNSTLIAVRWTDNSNDEAGFLVEFSLDNGTTWASVGWNQWANATSLSHFGRTPEQTVCYRVLAFNSFGNSPPSNVDCTAPPLAPTPLSANGVPGPAIDLAWPDNSAVEDGYEVRRAGPDGQWSTIAVLPAGTATYHDAGIAASFRYTYNVAARKDGGYSDFVWATAISASAPPAAPTSVSAVPQNSSAIAVTWAGQTDNVESFRLERSTDNGASWVAAGSVPWSQQGFWDVVPSEQATCYRVIAVNGAGESAPSDVYCATAPAGPTVLSATPVDGAAIDLSWTDNSTVEDGFEVRQVFSSCGYYYYYCYTYYVTIEVLPANTTSFRHLGLDPFSFNTYVVVARKDGGDSDLSNEAGSYPGPAVP